MNSASWQRRSELSVCLSQDSSSEPRTLLLLRNIVRRLRKWRSISCLRERPTASRWKEPVIPCLTHKP